MKLINIDKSTDELKEKLQFIFSSLNINKDIFKDFLDNPSFFLLIYSICEIFFGVMGIFGSFIGNFLSCIFYAITNYIYFAPYFIKISLYDTKEELFLNCGTFAALLLVTFYPYDISEPKETEEEKNKTKEIEKAKNKSKSKKRKSS